MKNQYFEKIENRYVFNLSRIFWHFFIGIGTLAIIAGVCVLAYTLVPVFKKKVNKSAYPPEVKVELSDLVEPSATPALPVEEETPVAPAIPSTDPDKPLYDSLFHVLELLIPSSKYSWEGEGKYVYPSGENYWNYYHTDKYRVFVKTGGGVIDNLNDVYERTDCYSYKNKAVLLQSYLNVLAALNEEVRMTWLNNLINSTKHDFKSSADLYNLLATTISKFSKSDLSYLHSLIEFGNQNPKDVFPFISMVNSDIGRFDVNYRPDVLSNLIDAHRLNFNNNVPVQQKLTEGFLTFVQHFTGDQQSKALMRYYRVYLGKNRERQASIDQIETEFGLEVSKAESDYLAKKSEKQELRLSSVISIGAGIAFVSIIAILLVFLAIQRSVKGIEERMIVSNKDI